jgi:hypothetical protein
MHTIRGLHMMPTFCSPRALFGLADTAVLSMEANIPKSQYS